MTNNPADLKLTNVQANVFNIISVRHKSGRITTRADIDEALGGIEKSWACRVLRSLTEKGLIERYGQRYYKLSTKGE